MRLHRIRAGELYDVYVLLDHRGRSSVSDELDAARGDEKDQCLRRIIQLADVGPAYGGHYSLADSRAKIWYLRASKHIRIWFFVDSDRILLTNAIRKTKKATDPQGLVRARALREQYYREGTGSA